jgi:hypothetical protein
MARTFHFGLHGLIPLKVERVGLLFRHARECGYPRVFVFSCLKEKRGCPAQVRA